MMWNIDHERGSGTPPRPVAARARDGSLTRGPTTGPLTDGQP